MEYLLTILPRANNFLLIEDLVVLISDEHASAGTAGVLAWCSPLMLLTRAWQAGTPAVPATAFQISTRYFSETTFQESSLALISNQLERSLVTVRGLGLSSCPPEQIGARGVQQVIPFQIIGQRINQS